MTDHSFDALETMPPALADDRAAYEVMALYDELADRAADGFGAARDRTEAMQEVERWLERYVDAKPRDPEHERRLLADQMFEAGFRRGVVFTRWLDATLADPALRLNLMALTMDFPWMLDSLAPSPPVTEERAA